MNLVEAVIVAACADLLARIAATPRYLRRDSRPSPEVLEAAYYFAGFAAPSSSPGCPPKKKDPSDP